MDTRFWGPSGWKLLHLICYTYPEKPEQADIQNYGVFMYSLKYVLPCKYCRMSFSDYLDDLPIEGYLSSRSRLRKWIYLMHNKVNKKLRSQGLLNYPDPTLSEVDKNYKEMLKTPCLMPGWDFLYCIAFNFPKKKDITIEKVLYYITFFEKLSEVLPCPVYRKHFQKIIEKNPPQKALNQRSTLTKWLYNINCQINKIIKEGKPKYNNICFTYESHRAGACEKKNHKGVTCRSKKEKKDLGLNNNNNNSDLNNSTLDADSLNNLKKKLANQRKTKKKSRKTGKSRKRV